MNTNDNDIKNIVVSIDENLNAKKTYYDDVETTSKYEKIEIVKVGKSMYYRTMFELKNDKSINNFFEKLVNKSYNMENESKLS